MVVALYFLNFVGIKCVLMWAFKASKLPVLSLFCCCKQNPKKFVATEAQKVSKLLGRKSTYPRSVGIRCNASSQWLETVLVLNDLIQLQTSFFNDACSQTARDFRKLHLLPSIKSELFNVSTWR